MKRYNIKCDPGPLPAKGDRRIQIKEASNGEWVRHEDVAGKKTMIERHWEVARKRADDEKERADKYEDMLIRINKMIFTVGLRMASDNYWTVRGLCAEAERAKNNRLKPLADEPIERTVCIHCETERVHPYSGDVACCDGFDGQTYIMSMFERSR